MPILKSIGTKALSLALAFAVLPVAVPSNVPLIGASRAEAQNYDQRGRPFYLSPRVGGGRTWDRERGWDHGGGWDRGRDDRGRGWDRGRDDRYYNQRRDYRERSYYRDRPYYRRNNNGAAIAGAIIGLGVGAAIASQPRNVYRAAPVYSGGYRPWTREWYRYCSNRYRSFDARSGTFQPYGGPRQMCR